MMRLLQRRHTPANGTGSILIGLLILIGIVFGTAGPAAAQDLLVIVADQNQAPIEGAKVYAYTDAGVYTGQYAVTGADGAANLGDMAQFTPGAHKLKAKYLGQEIWSNSVDLPAAGPVPVTIESAPVSVSAAFAGQPAVGVKVYLYTSTDSCLSIYQVTGDTGLAEFNLPVGGSYKFRADILGSQYFSQPLTVASGSGQNAVIDAGGGQLAVHVQKDDSQPLAEITLKLYSPQGCYLGQSAASDSSGNAAFAVSAGTYRIRAEYLGHQIWSDDTSVTGDSTVTIAIAHSDVTITVNSVLNAASSPIADARVQLFTATGSWVSLGAYTDAAGQAMFSLPQLGYKARVSYLGTDYWSDEFNGSNIEVDIPTAVAEVTLNWNGTPLADVPVTVFTAAGGWTNIENPTDANGKSRFELPAGTWKFRADYQSNQYWSADTALMADATAVIDLSTGGGTLTLNVGKDNAEPLEGLNCTVYNANGAWTGVRSATNSQGQALFDLGAGSYKVRVDYLGHQFWSEVYDISTAVADTFQILHHDITVSVNGVFDSAVPLEGARVKIYTGMENWTPLYQYSDSAGQAIFSLPEKEFKARVDYLQSQTWSPVFVAQNTSVDVALSEVQITVTGAGHPLENAKVYAYTDTEQCVYQYGYTDSAGRIDFRLPVGNYKFRAEYLGHKFWSDTVAASAGVAHPIEIATGGGNFSFTVLKDAQSPVANAKCYLYNADGTKYLGLWAYSDEYGKADFDLVDGSYSFKVCYLGYDYYAPAVQVPQVLSQAFVIEHSDIVLTINGILGSATPIEGAWIYLYTASDKWLGCKQVTNAAGQVTYSLPANDFKIKVSYLGHTFWSQPFNNQDAAVNIPMAKAEVTVTGAGEYLEGIKVYVTTATGGWLGVDGHTDPQGQITFRLPAGDFKFKACYQGKYFLSQAVSLVPGGRTPVAVDTGGGIFTLRVQKDAYQGLENAKCYVYTDDAYCTGIYGTTDTRGYVTFALSEGGYKFKVKYQGYYFWSDSVSVPGTLTHAMDLAHQRHDIFVQGINPGPEPLEGIKLYTYTATGSWVDAYGYTDAQGKISFDLPAATDGYKVKYSYSGQTYWSDILKPDGTLISINQGTGAVLPAVADLTAVVNGSRIDLSWSPLTDAGVAGYALYRRNLCADSFVRINVSLIAPSANAFSDTDLSPDATYSYYMAAVSDAGVQGLASASATTGFGGDPSGGNTSAIVNLAAAWDQGVAQLTWDPIAGHSYQIFRGSDPDTLSPWQRTATPPYRDEDSDPYHTWYYQVASVQTQCHPATGQPVDQMGPLSALVTLAGMSAPSAGAHGLQINANGDYVITTGAGSGYTMEGTYSGLDGNVTVTAVLGDQVITGTGANGQFSITLPTAGDWQIVISQEGGWQQVAIDTDWQVDDQPPSLTVDGPAVRSTTESMINITGLADDAQSALAGVSITSDRYAGTTFAASLVAMGGFSGQVPLKVGDNIITVTAADAHGNTSSRTVTVTQTLTALPVVRIISPAEGATVTSDRIDVSGTVRSSLPPGQIRLILADQVMFPAGGDNVYDFTFNDIALVPGSNLLTLRAETLYGNVSVQTSVQYQAGTGQQQVAEPRIEVLSPLPDSFLTGQTMVTGLVTGDAGIAAVSVNGAPAQTTGLGSTYVSFQAALSFSAGQQSMAVSISATDLNNRSTSLDYTVHLDDVPPVITLQDGNLQPPPAVNGVTQSPYIIAGTITEASLAGAGINDQPISLAPAAAQDTYAFSASLPLTFGQDAAIVLTAWDFAGNRTSSEWIVRLDSNLQIEVIAPRSGAELQGEGSPLDVGVTVRIPGAAGDAVFKVSVDGGLPVTMARSASVGNATVGVDLGQDDHRLQAFVENSAGIAIASTESGFATRNLSNVPLAVERQNPVNGATGIEPNDFIALYFNKAIDPALLQVEVLETVHGQTYASLDSGADITQLSNIELVEVHRDREPVPGGISHFPGNRMVAFYPARDLAYGAEIFITAVYDGAELVRSTYACRPLPTFIEGFVIDSATNPVDGISVALSDPAMTTRTNSDGAYGFGYGLAADQTIAPGRHKLVVNPGLENRAYGTLEYWAAAIAGRRSSVFPIKLPVLSPRIPFRRVISGQAANVLAGGALTLDLTAAGLTFPDLRDQGDLHVQFLSVDQFPYAALGSATPLWTFCVQPGGVKVSGQVALSMAIPARSGSYAYLDDFADLVVLVGLDPDALMLVPVGVGQVDLAAHTVVSQGAVHLQRLDFIGYAHIRAEARPLLAQYVNGDVSLQQMTAGLENMMQP